MGWGLMSPALAPLALMAVAPAIYLVYVSFRHENLPGPGSMFVGLQNFYRVLSNRENWTDALSTIEFVALSVSFEVGFGLGLALLLNRRLSEADLLTALFILPLGVAPVVSALVFRVLLDPAYGWIDYYLQTWGVISEPDRLARQSRDRLGRGRRPRRLAVDAIRHADSARRPGRRAVGTEGGGDRRRAGPVLLFWHITLPFLRPFIVIALVLRAIEAFKTFGSIFVLTTGGPGTSTEVINLDLYRIALQNFDIGAAAALGLLFLLFLLIIMRQLLKVLGRNTDILED